MTRLYHTAGQDNWQPRPQSGLSREWVHGPLQPMNAESFVNAARPILAKASWIVTSFAVGLCAVLAAYHVAVWFWG